jgi:hypothetical protein
VSEPPATRTLPAGSAARGARIRLRTRDLDEAQAAGADAYHSHRVSVLGDRDRFGLRLDTVRMGGLTLGRLSYGTEVSVETTEPPTAYQVNVPVSGTVRAWSDDERAVAVPGRAVVHHPGRRHGFQGWASPCRVFGLRIDRQCLEQELKIMADRPVRTPIAFPLALDLRSGPGRHWWSLVQVVAAQLWINLEVHLRHGAAVLHNCGPVESVGLELVEHHGHQPQRAAVEGRCFEQ